jgi:hypothetical protein
VVRCAARNGAQWGDKADILPLSQQDAEIRAFFLQAAGIELGVLHMAPRLREAESYGELKKGCEVQALGE